MQEMYRGEHMTDESNYIIENMRRRESERYIMKTGIKAIILFLAGTVFGGMLEYKSPIKEYRSTQLNNDSIPDLYHTTTTNDTTYFLGQSNGTYQLLEQVKQEELEQINKKIDQKYNSMRK
jgi:hypothetical protein